MNKEITTAILRVLPFAIALLILFLQKERDNIKTAELDLQSPNSWSRFAFCIISFLIFILTIEVILFKSGILEITKWNHPLFSSIIRIFGAVILAPVAEELIFRGLILSKLSKKINMHLAIFLQAVLFVLLHNFTYENTLSSNIGIAQSLIDATLFGYARFYTKSIYTPMAMHFTGNLIATLERFIL